MTRLFWSDGSPGIVRPYSGTGGRLASDSSRLIAVGLTLLIGLAIVVGSAFAVFMPALFLFLFLLALSLLPSKPQLTVCISAGTAILLFGWLNVEKVPTNDWAWYTTHYRWLSDMPLSSYLGGVFGGIKIRWSEPVYHTLAAILSHLTNGNVAALAVMVTVIIYGSVVSGIYMMTRGHLASVYGAALVTWVPIAIGITFTLTTQLVRQEIAAAVAFLGFSLILVNRKVWGWSLVATAILTHNSALFPILCIIMASYVAFKTNLRTVSGARLAGVLGALLGVGFLFSPSGETYYISQQDDGRVALMVYFMDASIFVTLLLLRKRLGDFERLLKVLIISVVCFTGFILAVAPAPLLLLRMYFYMDFFRVAMLVLVVLGILRGRNGWLPGLMMPLVALLYVEARIAVSPLHFYGGVLVHLTRPFAFFR